MYVFAFLLSLLAPPADLSFTLETQTGRVATLDASTSEDAFIYDALCWARHHREAVAVCQSGRLVVLINYDN